MALLGEFLFWGVCSVKESLICGLCRQGVVEQGKHPGVGSLSQPILFHVEWDSESNQEAPL